MLDAKAEQRLKELLRRESRSLLQYIADAFPWTTPEENGALSQLQGLIDEERRALSELAKFLIRNRITPPSLGPYPIAFTSLNFVSFDHLLPLMVNAQRQAVLDLERDLQSFAGPECRQQVQKILELKRKHLKTFEALAAAHPERVTP